MFFRVTAEAKKIHFVDWFVLTFFELIFGEEILEQLALTASYNNKTENEKTGHMLNLTDMVPSGLLTNFFRHKIIQLLYYKYYNVYFFLESKCSVIEHGNTLNLSRVQFAMRHELLYQIIAFRRVYLLTWLIINITVDVLVYYSQDLQSAILSALALEALRRISRV